MITLEAYGIRTYNGTETKLALELRGLSTDTKPTDYFAGYAVRNGSVFVEINTHTLYMFDEEHSEWIAWGEA